MRNLQKTLAFFGIVVTAGLGQLVGCANDAENCELNYEACSGSSSSSSGVVPPPGCADSPSQNAEVIRTDCAYFVGGSKASDSNTGGEADPFARLSDAINAAKTKKARVYLCGNVSERVEIPAWVSVFGGFDCTGDEWQYNETMRGSIAPDAPAADAAFQSSVRITGSGTSNIEDINISAASAAFPGGSSIAVIVDGATVNFIRADLTAGDGSAGAQGVTPTDDVGPDSAADPAVAGNAGVVACNGGVNGVEGGAAKTNMLCPESIGGKGGNGKNATGDPGEDGLPANTMSGLGGDGEDAAACTEGTHGRHGDPGNHGTGATDPGMIDGVGYTGNSGLAGSKGMIGQGGGGGGGAKGKSTFYGASGGGGGAGGCPGNGGGGGSAGGSSIGIVHLSGTLSFSSAKITVGAGGQGGAGGDGQIGGSGGNGGMRGPGSSCGMGPKTADACDGGNGGNGGQGGQGGGGFGGHSIGIAYKKGTPAPATMGATIQTGSAGAGGTGGDATGTGGNGIKDNTHELN